MKKDKEFLRQLGQWISIIRRDKKMTQRDLEKATGITLNAISRIESGLSDPKASTLRKFADALDIPLLEIFDIDRDNIIHKDDTKLFLDVLHEMRGLEPQCMAIMKSLAKSLRTEIPKIQKMRRK